MTPSLLRLLVRETLIAASTQYMKKEAVRKELEDSLYAKIRAGQINSQDQWLSELTPSLAAGGEVSLAANALKMVPFEIAKKLATR